MLDRVWRLSAGTFSLLGGAMIAVAINFYTGIYSGDELPSRWPLLLLAAGASLVSSFLWSLISWTLDSVQRLAISEAPSWIKGSTAEAAWLSLLTPRKKLLRWSFFLAVLSGLVGLSSLPIGSVILHPKPPISKPGVRPVERDVTPPPGASVPAEAPRADEPSKREK